MHSESHRKTPLPEGTPTSVSVHLSVTNLNN
jgi:hypothetical protein